MIVKECKGRVQKSNGHLARQVSVTWNEEQPAVLHPGAKSQID
jgi:hypothetical protein